MTHFAASAFFYGALLIALVALTETVRRYRHEIIAALLNEFDRPKGPTE